MNKISEDIGFVVSQTKNYEKIRNFYVGAHLREEIAMKKNKVSMNFSNFEEALKSAETEKKSAELSLEFIKEKLAESKKVVESLKLKKPKKTEENKTYLATEKLAFTKKVTGTDRASKSGSQTPRKSKKQ